MMFRKDMTYSEALTIVANAYATKTKEEADKVYAEYQKFSDEILRHELKEKDALTSYSYLEQ